MCHGEKSAKALSERGGYAARAAQDKEKSGGDGAHARKNSGAEEIKAQSERNTSLAFDDSRRARRGVCGAHSGARVLLLCF